MSMMAKIYAVVTTVLLLATTVMADYNGMDMSMDGGMSMTMGNMLMYFHFTPGDNLWFLGWVPSSTGAMVGTCIGLFLLALVERWLSTMKAVMEAHWHARALIEMANRANRHPLPSHTHEEHHHQHQQQESQRQAPKGMIRQHLAPPFILAHDLPRGIIAATIALLGFLFMLAVMTFQVSFILSIVIGLGVGETLFGRFGRGSAGRSLHC